MITEQIIVQGKKEGTVHCGLCRCNVKDHPTIKRLGAKLGIICSDCAEQFSDQEIELMANMFQAFGGYFNQFNSTAAMQQKIIEEVAAEYIRKEQSSAKLRNDVRTLHRAFLHGISLGQLVREVQETSTLNPKI